MRDRSRSWSVVAEGVHRLDVAHVNCYLVVRPDGMTLVDAGLPGTWGALREVLGHLRATPADIDAVVLTHGHFDHVGIARRLQRAHETPVHVHARDRRLARHPYLYRPERARPPYLARYPRALPVLGDMVLHGALGVRGVTARASLANGHPLDVPGSPVPLWTPGHTDGHCALLFDEIGILFSGDAIVTLDPYTAETGPRLVANAATADSRAALASLDALAQVEAPLMLPGHGEPWRDGVRAAARLARAAGAR
ncbi:MBL fold metallo-hydrolase [Microbacterium barkeri]